MRLLLKGLFASSLSDRARTQALCLRLCSMLGECCSCLIQDGRCEFCMMKTNENILCSYDATGPSSTDSY